MTSVSSCYAAPLLVLLLLAALPVLRMQFLEPVDDCANPTQFLDFDAIPGTRVSQQRGVREHGKDFVIQWTVGRVSAPQLSGPTEFGVVRSFDNQYVQLSPALALAAPLDVNGYVPTVHPVRAGDLELPIHVIRKQVEGRERVVSYLFVYDGEPVRDPLRAQLASALPQLVSGTLPLTVLSTSVVVSVIGAETAQRVQERWLISAWDHYRAACHE